MRTLPGLPLEGAAASPSATGGGVMQILLACPGAAFIPRGGAR
jgi:hypothetical protein